MPVPNTPVPERLRILCVDDDTGVRNLLSRLLQRAGYACEVVAGGREALEKIGAAMDGFGLVLTDQHMPGMDGLGLVQALREAGFPGRIVVHSSPLDAPCRSAYERLRVDAFIEKPAKVSTLLQTITDLTGGVPPRSTDY
jgi:CheY-like chemotaxis protein